MPLHTQRLLISEPSSNPGKQPRNLLNNLLASTVWTSTIGTLLSIFLSFICFVIIISDRIASPSTSFSNDNILLASSLFFLLFSFLSIIGVTLGFTSFCVWAAHIRKTSIAQFLKQVKKQEYLFDKVAQLKQTDPILMWHIRVLDSHQHEVLYKSTPFEYEYAVDISSDFQVDSPFRPFTQLVVRVEVDMDNATKEAFQEMERDLIRKYGVGANTHYETWYTVHLPGLLAASGDQSSTKLHLHSSSSKQLSIASTDEYEQDSLLEETLVLKVSRENSSSGKTAWRFVNRLSYYFLSLICMGNKYRNYLESLCGFQTFVSKKKIYGVPKPQFSLY